MTLKPCSLEDTRTKSKFNSKSFALNQLILFTRLLAFNTINFKHLLGFEDRVTLKKDFRFAFELNYDQNWRSVDLQAVRRNHLVDSNTGRVVAIDYMDREMCSVFADSFGDSVDFVAIDWKAIVEAIHSFAQTSGCFNYSCFDNYFVLRFHKKKLLSFVSVDHLVFDFLCPQNFSSIVSSFVSFYCRLVSDSEHFLCE